MHGPTNRKPKTQLQSIHVTRDRYFWNFDLHVSFEHPQRDFRIPVEISLVYWREFFVTLQYEVFSEYQSFLKYFRIFSSLYASFSERFSEKCSTFHSNTGHYKEEFECSFHSGKYRSRVTWIVPQNCLQKNGQTPWNLKINFTRLMIWPSETIKVRRGRKWRWERKELHGWKWSRVRCTLHRPTLGAVWRQSTRLVKYDAVRGKEGMTCGKA